MAAEVPAVMPGSFSMEQMDKLASMVAVNMKSSVLAIVRSERVQHTPRTLAAAAPEELPMHDTKAEGACHAAFSTLAGALRACGELQGPEKEALLSEAQTFARGMARVFAVGGDPYDKLAQLVPSAAEAITVRGCSCYGCRGRDPETGPLNGAGEQSSYDRAAWLSGQSPWGQSP